MNSELEKRVLDTEMAYAEETLEQQIALHAEKKRDKALMLIGGFHAATRIAKSIDSEVMRALETFQQEQLHQAFGFDRFADFLDRSEVSPMTKHQYYERKTILEKEGDHLFDILSGVGLSVRKRKLLGSGSVELDGDKLVVHADEDLEIELSDRTRILETLSALADANADKSARLARQKEKIDRHDAEKRELYDEIDRTKAAKAAEAGRDPHALARLDVILAVARLREVVADMPAVEREQFRDGVLEDIAGQIALLRAAYRTGAAETPVENTVLVGETIDEQLENFLDTVDLDAGNDAELAAAL